MEKKEKKNWFLVILFILFILYLSLYTLDNLGYYNIAAKKNILTEEKIKEFETDIKTGQVIDIKEYIRDTTDYKNLYSNLGYNMSVGIDEVLNKGIKKIGVLLKKLLK